MCKELSESFISSIENFDDKKYLLSTITYNVAPVIAKYKPSYLFIFHNQGKRKLYDFWEKYKYSIGKELNIKYFELKKEEYSSAVLFYDKNQMDNILKEDKYIYFLAAHGYKVGISLEEVFITLKERYAKFCPHEMGLFLGYPLEDVLDFMENPNKEALIFGYWKVYHNAEKAQDTFKKYDEIKMKVINLINEGVEPYGIVESI
ncbi:hypothetical protein CLHOM_30700 [Clostridium homopropionicum DSM 5847]|uniref:DUF3793 family protein n=1 Tax=Clostridium homopropionicum DSM 5847 TaxID=1121318 RepID=A0A0L6Z5G2_9CLOT|nr:DUF3793 family protein [Clostridium homopropionicum]KOA18192.1 hypothetical protein CLHOM_30700 [Clostridium homopropionicum DSM 5847]SFF71529.1 Protein of unknown function [Clostridium homopropionicum]